MSPTAFTGSTPPQREQGLVTPEAVVLDFSTAGVGSRTAAQLVDLAIRGFLVFVLSVAAFALDELVSVLPSWLAVSFFTLMIAFFILGYSVAFETIWKGETPGKALLGLRVVTEEGSPIRFRHAAVRGAVGLFEITAASGVIAFITVFASQRNQRLGDMAAGTLVLRERQASKAPVATTFTPPEGMEDYASTLEVAALGAEEYLTIRAFLTRANSLVPQARESIANDLARQFAVRLNASPPQDMTAEVFLLCVAAAYQRRFSSSGRVD